MVGSGLILWMPKGAIVRGILESFIKEELLRRGYQPVYTPHIGRLELYRTSGHFPYYRDAQFPPMYSRPAAGVLDLCQYRLSLGVLDEKREHDVSTYMKSAHFVPSDYEKAATQEAKLEAVHRYAVELMAAMHVELPEYAAAKDAKGRADALLKWLMEQEGFLLKPMNCPHHIHIYKAEARSYRDLPVRLAEFGTVYRYEQTGELSGMTRVRGFTQDDAHLFVTEDQVDSEMRANLDLVFFVLRSLGLTDYRVRLGLREPGAAKYVGDPADWDRAETTLKSILQDIGMPHSVEPGEAAFYGPKIDFVVRDCIGREWQLGTVQLDYNLPARFQLEYIGPDNKPHRPVMIHRAPFGSMERFIGILIEHFAGAFPLWLAPEQVRVLPISEKTAEYGRAIEAELKERGFRSGGDWRPEKIGAKIREAQLDKVPYMLVVGEKEAAAGTVAVRDRLDGDLGAMPLAQVIDRLTREVDSRTIRQISAGPAATVDSGERYSD
jgi:threonyl-tRNA synthetase